MRNVYYVLAVVFSFFFVADTSAQKINHVDIQDSCNAGKDSSIVVVRVSSPQAGMSLATYWGDGSSTLAAIPNSTSPVVRKHHYSTAGVFSIKNVLIVNSTAIDSSLLSHNKYCSYVSISSFIDANKNCIMESTEQRIALGVVYEIDSAGVIIDTITGWKNFRCTPGITYKARIIKMPLGASALCPSTGVITFTGPTVRTQTFIEFGIQPGAASAFDLFVGISGMFRPVRTSTISVYAGNNSITGNSATVTLNISGKYKYKSATPPPTTVNGNTITWNVANLSIYKVERMYVELDTAGRHNAGDTVCNMVTITPTSGDVNPVNNTVKQCDAIRAAWDPNDKHVYPAGKILPGTKLNYTINFENLGDDTAFNISVLDTLPAEVIPKTLKIIAASHKVSHLFLDGPAGRKIVRFDFADIHLADKSAPDYNKGFVQFSIDTKADLPPLTKISNRAGIYFDINPVVLTNYAENNIPATSVSKISVNNDLSVYPNPVTDILTIKTENSNYETLKIINTMGQVVAEQAIQGDVSQINIRHLPTGVYYVLLNGESGSISRKIEKR